MTTNNKTSHTLEILLVVWRELDDLSQLHQDFKAQTFQDYHVRVALNDPDDRVEACLPNDPKWSYYRGDNSGYAGGLERLWRETQSEWVLISNTDIRLKEDFLSLFMKRIQSVEDHIGYIGPKILFDDGRLQCGAGLVLGPEGLCKPRGIGEEDNTLYDHLTEVPVLSGCCFMIRKKVIEDVNGFDSRFFMYVEDVHLFLKAVWAGWIGLYASEITLVHAHGGSNERYGELHLYHLERNHWWVMFQLPWSMRLMKPFYLLYRWFVLAFCNRGPSRGKIPSGSSKIAIKALVHGLCGIPRMLFQKSPRRISTKRFNDIFKEHRIDLNEFLAK